MNELESPFMNMKFDETELIDFFGILPTEQDTEEKEFFGTTIFDYFQEGVDLSISYSKYRNDFFVFLKAKGLEKPLVEIYFENVTEIKVRKDKPISTPALLISAAREDKREVLQTIEITLEPNINIKLYN